MLKNIFTSAHYDPETIKQEEKMLKHEGQYLRNPMSYSPFVGNINYCSKASQMTGTDAVCSPDASFARNPVEVSTTLKVQKLRKGPDTYHMTYDDIAQNRGQENSKWFMVPPAYWERKPIKSATSIIGVNTVQKAKEAFGKK